MASSKEYLDFILEQCIRKNLSFDSDSAEHTLSRTEDTINYRQKIFADRQKSRD